MFSDSQWQWLRWVVVIVIAMIAAAVDIRHRRIPNIITAPLLLSGLLTAVIAAGVEGLQDALLGSVVAGAPFVVLWFLGGGGAGDAKMMLAVGAWLGFRDGAVALLCVSLLGGIVAIAYAVARRQLLPMLGRLLGLSVATAFAIRGGGRGIDRQDLLPKLNARDGIPYGLAICLGLCTAATGVWLW